MKQVPQKQSVNYVNNHLASDLESRGDIPSLTARYAHSAEEKTKKGQGGRAARDKNEAVDRRVNRYTRLTEDIQGIMGVAACKSLW